MPRYGAHYSPMSSVGGDAASEEMQCCVDPMSSSPYEVYGESAPEDPLPSTGTDTQDSSTDTSQDTSAQTSEDATSSQDSSPSNEQGDDQDPDGQAGGGGGNGENGEGTSEEAGAGGSEEGGPEGGGGEGGPAQEGGPPVAGGGDAQPADGAPGGAGAAASTPGADDPKAEDVGLVPAIPGRIGGTEPPKIADPPPMAPDQKKGIKRVSGLSPDEHHDRVRGQVNRIAASAHRTQVRIIHEVEQLATDIGNEIRKKGNAVPGLVSGAVRRVTKAVDDAITAVEGAARNTLFNIDNHDTENATGVDDVKESTVENIEAAILAGDAEMARIYNEVSGLFDTEAQTAKTAMEEVPRTLTPTLATATASLGDSLTRRSGENDFETYKNERRGVNMPALAAQQQASFQSGANARGLNMISPTTKAGFSMQFLQVTQPAAVVETVTGGEDAEAMMCVAEERTVRLASTRERARAMVNSTKEQAVNTLNRIKTDTVQGLWKAGDGIQKAMKAQAEVTEESLLGSADPFAQSMRDYMRKIRSLFPPGRFYDVKQYWPRIAHGVEELEKIRKRQMSGLEGSGKEALQAADKAFKEQIQGLYKMASDVVKQVGEVKDPSVRDIEQIGLTFIEGQTEDANLVCEAGPTHEQNSTQNLSEFGQRVRTTMINAVNGQGGGEQTAGGGGGGAAQGGGGAAQGGGNNARANFRKQVEDYKAECERVRDNFDTVAAQLPDGVYAAIDEETETDINHRAEEVKAAADHTVMGFSATDETRMFNALLGLSYNGAWALQWYYANESGYGSLYSTVSGELADDDDEWKAGTNLVLGNNAEGVEALIKSSFHWYGNDRTLAINAMRSLNSTELAEMKTLEGWASTQSELLGSMYGTDLDVTTAYINGDRALAFALQTERRLTEARMGLNEDTMVDRAAELRRLAREELANEYRTRPMSEADLQRFQGDYMRAHAGITGQRTKQEAAGLTDQQAMDLFVEHTTRDNPSTRQWEAQRREYARTHPESQTSRYPPRKMSEPARHAVEDLLRHGPESPIAQGSQLAYEYNAGKTRGLTQSRVERIQKAGDDQGLASAQRAYDEASARGDWVSIRIAEENLRKARERHQQMISTFADRTGAPAEVKNDPEAAQRHSSDLMEGLFARQGSWGQRFAREMMQNGRASLLATTMLATDRSGTWNGVLKNGYQGRTFEEFQELRQAYATEVAKDPNDLRALDRHLGTFGASSSGELSGDDRQEVEDLMLGIIRNDTDRARHAYWQFRHQYSEIGNGGRAAMSGTPQSRRLHAEYGEMTSVLEQVIRANGGSGPAFDAMGNPNPAAMDANGNLRTTDQTLLRSFRSASLRTKFASEAYKAELDRKEKFLLDIIQLLGAIIAVALMFIPGVNLLVAGIIAAVLTGMATIAVKSSMRGSRYGYEEMLTDVALTAVDVATAALGGAKFMKFGALGKVGGAMAREAITGAINSAARVALDSETWRDGFGDGLLRVGGGALRGAAVGAVTAGVSEAAGNKLNQALRGVNPSNMGAMRRLGDKLGDRGSTMLSEAISESLGAMAGEAVGITVDKATGKFPGGFDDALGQIAFAGARDFVTGGLRAGARHMAEARRDRIREQILTQEHPPTREQLRQLMIASFAANDNSMWGESGMARLQADIAVSREAIRTIPPSMRSQFAGLPPHMLAQLGAWMRDGGDIPVAQRLAFAQEAFAAGVRLDPSALGKQVGEGSRELAAIAAQNRAARKALVASMPPHLRGNFADLRLEGLNQLPPEGLARVAEMMKSGQLGSPRERLELFRMAQAADPKLDRTTFMRNLADAVAAGVRVKADAVAARREAIGGVPQGARAALAALPETHLARAMELVRLGENGTEHQRENLFRAALRESPGLNRDDFFRGLDAAIEATRSGQAKAQAAEESARAHRLGDMPDHVRGPLAVLPDSALDQVRLLQIRGDTGTPHERESLIRAALAENPRADVYALLRAVDQAVAHANRPSEISRQGQTRLREQMLSGVPSALRGAFLGVPITVLPAKRFEALTRSAKGNAVTLMIDGQPHVILREGANPAHLREEGMHLMQLMDPAWARRVGALDEAHLRDWDQLPLAEQVNLYRNKVEIEIDAQHRMLASLQAEWRGNDDPIQSRQIRERMDAALATLDNLQKRHAEVARLGTVEQMRIRMGMSERPQFLDQPARLFSKDPPAIDPAVQERIDRMTGVKREGEAEVRARELADEYRKMEEATVEVLEVSGKRTEQMVDPAGNLMTNPDGSPYGYVVPYRYDVRFYSHGLAEITLKIHLSKQRGVTDSDLQRVQRDARSGIDQYYNDPNFTVRDPLGRPAQLRVRLEFVTDPADAHLSVKVHPRDGQAFQDTWFVEGGATTHAHELTHQLGRVDEYVDHAPHGNKAANRATATSPGVRTDHGLMTNYWTVDASGKKIVHPKTHLAQRYIDEMMGDIYGAWRKQRTDMQSQVDRMMGIDHATSDESIQLRNYFAELEAQSNRPTPVTPPPTTTPPRIGPSRSGNTLVLPAVKPSLWRSAWSGIKRTFGGMRDWFAGLFRKSPPGSANPMLRSPAPPPPPPALRPAPTDPNDPLHPRNAPEGEDPANKRPADDGDDPWANLPPMFARPQDIPARRAADDFADARPGDYLGLSPSQLQQIVHYRQLHEGMKSMAEGFAAIAKRHEQMQQLFPKGESYVKAREKLEKLSGMDDHDWDHLDSIGKLKHLGLYDTWASMTMDEMKAILRDRSGKTEAAFEKWWNDEGMAAKYAAGERPNPFDYRLLEIPQAKGKSGDSAPDNWVPPPADKKTFRPKSLDSLPPDKVRELLGHIRNAGQDAPADLRQLFTELGDIVKRVREAGGATLDTAGGGFADRKGGNAQLSDAEVQKVLDLLTRLEGQRIDQNPLLADAWEYARAKIYNADPNSERGKSVAAFQKGEVTVNKLVSDLRALEAQLAALGSGGSATDRTKLLASIRVTSAKLQSARGKLVEHAAEVYSMVRGEFGKAMSDAMLHIYQDHPDWFDLKKESDRDFVFKPIPSSLEVHHMLYKAIFPEHAVALPNLLLANRNQEKGGTWQLHELMHEMSAGKANKLFNVLVEEIARILHQHVAP